MTNFYCCRDSVPRCEFECLKTQNEALSRENDRLVKSAEEHIEKLMENTITFENLRAEINVLEAKVI